MTKLVFTALLSSLFFSLSTAWALQAPMSQEIPYYGEEFYAHGPFSANDQQIKDLLKKILRSKHLKTQGALDQIVQSCGGPNCYGHVAVGYNRARVFMFGNYYLVNQNGGYGVRDVYCQKVFGSNEFSSRKPGPNQIPNDTVVNAEHTWPQSRFSSRFDKEMQKSDVHHLYPTDSKMNGIRGNYAFGEVAHDAGNVKLPCTQGGARFGQSTSGDNPVFEPPTTHRGNVARSLFYFSIKYDLPIDAHQEAYLRKWNKEDPVDAEEADRNEKIFALQGSRNPFVDYPELADRIQDF